MTETATLDARDQEILTERVALLNEHTGPRVGDYVRFADDVLRRISYVWREENGTPFSVQTSTDGSFHLGRYGVSFSGSLFTGVSPDTLTLTDEIRAASVWIEHHGWLEAGCAVHADVPFRVYACSKETGK